MQIVATRPPSLAAICYGTRGTSRPAPGRVSQVAKILSDPAGAWLGAEASSWGCTSSGSVSYCVMETIPVVSRMRGFKVRIHCEGGGKGDAK